MSSVNNSSASSDSILLRDIETKLKCISSLQPMIDNITSTDPALTALKNVVSMLVAQVVDIKSDVVKLQHQSDNFKSNISSISVDNAKTEQYSRHNHIVMTGLVVDRSEAENKPGNLSTRVVN